MMDNYDRTMELVNVAYDSNGKATEQFGKYSDTLEYKLNQLTNTWEQMRLKFLNSDFLKKAVDNLNDLLKRIQSFKVKDFLQLGAVWITLGKSAIQNFIKGAQSGASLFQKGISTLFEKGMSKISFSGKFGTKKLSNELTSVQNTMKNLMGKVNQDFITYNDQELRNSIAKYEQTINTLKQEALSAGFTQDEATEWSNRNVQEQSGMSADDYNYAQAKLQEQQKQKELANKKQMYAEIGQAASQAFAASFTAGLTALKMGESSGKVFATSFIAGASTSLTSGMSAFSNALNAGLGALQGFKNGLISGAISLGVSALTAGVTAFVAWQEEEKKAADLERAMSNEIMSHSAVIEHLTEKQEELNQTYSEEQSQLDELQTEYDQLNEKFEIYTELANTPLKSAEEQEELLSVTNDLVDLMPEVVDYYNQEGEAVIQNTEKIQELINAKKQLLAQQKQETLKAQAEKDANDYSIAYNNAEKLKNAQEKYDKYNKYIKKMQSPELSPSQGSKEVLPDYSNDDVLQYILTGESIEGGNYKFGIDTILGTFANSMGEQGEDIIALIMEAIKDEDEALYNELAKDKDGKLLGPKAQAENLMNYIDESASTDEGEAATWSKISQYITSYYNKIGNEVQKANDELETQREKLEQDYKDSLRNSADLNEDFLNLNKNTQELVIAGAQQSVFGDSSVADKINEDIKKEHPEWFDEKEDGTFTVKAEIETSDAYQSAFSDKMNSYIDESEQYIKDFMNNLESDDIAKIDAVYKAAEENEWTWKDILEEFKRVFGETNPALLDAIVAQNKQNIEDYNKQLQETATYFGEQDKYTIDEDTGVMQYDEGTFTNWYQGLEDSTRNAIQIGMDAALRNVDPSSASAAAQAYGNEIKNAIESGLIDANIYKSFATSGIFTENFSFLDLEKTKEKFVEDVKEMGYSTEEAMANWDALYNYAEQYGMIDFGITTEDSLNETAKEIENNLNNIVKSYDSASSAITAQLENGGLNLTEYLSLSETLSEVGLNIQDYITGMQNGLYQLNTDAMTQAYHDAVEAESLTVDELRAQLTQRRNNLEAMLGQLDAEGNYQIAANNSTNSLWDQYDAAYALYEITRAKVELEGGNAGTKIAKAAFTPRGTVTTTISKQDIENEIAWIDNLLGSEKELQAYTDMMNAQQAAHTQISNKEADAIDKVAKANKGGSSAAKDAADAADKLREAQEKLNEALYGTENYKNAADHLANYTERLEELTEKADKAKESLENLGKEDSASELIATYAENVKLDNITRTAENQVLQQSMDDLLKILNEQYSEYFQKVGDTWMWNASVVDAKMNDHEKDFIIESIENLNEYQDKINENLDAIEEREKEFKEMRKTALDSRITLEEEVMDVLKENYQKEIDAAQEKYDALKEADDNYLDALEEAINKQRELRDKANQYEDLAQKERKLALKQRDTSGTNRKDTLQLQKEVEDSRQQMLDNEVDRLLESMREMYELQQESRDAELEYMNAMMENGQLLQEANEIIASFSTREDMLAWFFENNKELADMSVAATEKYKMELEEMYDAAELYYVMSETNLEELTSFTEEEVSNTVATIGETLTLEAERSYNEMRETVDKEVEDAKQAVIDAQKAVEDAAASAASAIGSAADYIKSKVDDMMNSGNTPTNLFDIATPTATGREEELKGKEAAAKLAATKSTYSKSYAGLKAAEYTEQAAASQKQLTNNTVLKLQNDSKNSDTIKVAKASDYNHAYSKDPSTKYKLVYNGTAYYFKSRTQFYEYKNKMPLADAYSGVTKNGMKIWNKYATGGLVDYTGPAWVDGTPSKPEAFLNSEDTKRIGEAAKLLSNLPILNSTSNASTQLSTNVGDTSIEIHINVESISSDYDVDRLAERIKSDIVDASKPVGTPVILKR